MSSTAQSGDQVKVHYTGKLLDGTVFDSSVERDPLDFKLGENMVIAGFEDAIIGMEVGQKKETTIANENAYGPYRDELCIALDREGVPAEMNPQPGEAIQLQTPDGMQLTARVVDVTDDELKVDANHPLAGQDLTFEIELVGIG